MHIEEYSVDEDEESDEGDYADDDGLDERDYKS